MFHQKFANLTLMIHRYFLIDQYAIALFRADYITSDQLITQHLTACGTQPPDSTLQIFAMIIYHIRFTPRTGVFSPQPARTRVNQKYLIKNVR